MSKMNESLGDFLPRRGGMHGLYMVLDLREQQGKEEREGSNVRRSRVCKGN